MAHTYIGDRARPLKTYITSDNFFNNIRVYTTDTSGTTFLRQGRLTTPGTSTNITTAPLLNVKTNVNLVSADCPTGRFLRETGRRLFPGQNPGLAVGDKYNGVVVGFTQTATMLVLVSDSVTGCSFYINPNDTVFSVYSFDKPLDTDSNLETSATPPLGAPVITAGSVTAARISTVSLYASNLVTTTQFRSQTVTVIPQTSGLITIDPSLGQVFTMPNTLANNIQIQAITNGVPAAPLMPGASFYLCIASVGDGGGGNGRQLQDGGASVSMPTITPLTNRAHSLHFISDGIEFRLVASTPN